MPAIGLVGSSVAAGIDGVVGADDQHDVGVGEVVVDFVHFQHDVVRNLGLGQQDVHVTGQPPGHPDFQLGLPGSEGNSFTDAMAMTAARCVNSVEAVVQAGPGFKTFLDLPPLTGKYTMHGR
jgi:hypothetical protein